MGNTTSVYKQISAYITIDTPGLSGLKIAVSQLELDFIANSIPRATAILAVGTTSDGATSPIQDQLKTLQQRLPIKIYLQVVARDSSTDVAQSTPYLILSGYSSGTSYNKTATTCCIVLGIVSILNDLAYSSAFSDLFAVATVGDPFMPLARENISGVEGAGKGDAGATIDAFAGSNFSRLSPNFWSDNKTEPVTQGLKSFLLRMCAASQLKPFLAQTTGNETLDISDPALNTLAANILNTCDMTPPGSISLHTDLAAPVVLESMMRSIANGIWSQGHGDTVWSKMLGQLIRFGLVFVPTADKFIIAAQTSMLKSTNIAAFTPISAAEYMSITTTGFRRPIQGVKFYAASGTTSGVGDVDRLCISAAFGWTTSLPGQILVTQGPPWLYLNGASTTDILTTTSGIYTGGTNPTGVDAGAPNPSSNEYVTTVLTDWASNGLGPAPRLAHMVFCDEGFRDNTATVVGKLRFDIVPGTCVQIEVPGKDLYKSDGLPEYIYANVAGVRINLSVTPNAAAASTTLFLTHTRTAGDDNLGQDEHPIFADYFVGKNYKLASVPPLETDIIDG